MQKIYTYNTLEKKRRKNRTDAPQYYVADNHEAIISNETFAVVQQEMSRRANLLGSNGRRSIYSGRYAFSGLAFCGKCGDILTRKTWYIHERTEVVWTCIERLNKGPDRCDLRYMPEKEFEGITIRAISLARENRTVNMDLAEECIAEGLNAGRDEKIAILEAEIKQLQQELLFLKSGSDEIETLGNKIIRLRDEKNALLDEAALEAQRAKDIRACAEVFDGMTTPLRSFDEQYVKRLISKILVYDDKVEFTFKDGRQIAIEE